MKTLISESHVDPKNGWFNSSPGINTYNWLKKCDVCGKEYSFTEKVTFYQHIPSTHTVWSPKIPPVSTLYWGYRKHSFDSCDDHTESELEHFVTKQKEIVT